MGHAPAIDTPTGVGQLSRIHFLVDPSMYWDDSVDRRPNANTHLDSLVRPDLRYHYSGPVCAGRWNTLCEDPQFGHLELVELIDHVFPDVVGAMRADCEGVPRVDLMSLGPGNGDVDVRILRNLEAARGVRWYYCLDSSFELLCFALGHVIKAGDLRREFSISAICGDFTRLVYPSCLSHPDQRARLFCLTGFTLGNHNEAGLLGGISKLMSDRDYLFLDARLHDVRGRRGKLQFTAKSRSSLVKSFQLKNVNRFVFGPLEVATLARAEDVQFDYELTDAVTAVPSAVNVLIFCRGLDTAMRLTGERIQRDRVDLAVSTFYDYQDLTCWFAVRGFRVLWRRNVGKIGFFLLKAERCP